MLRQLAHNQALVHPSSGLCCAARHLSRRAHQVTHRGWRACSSTSDVTVAPETSAQQNAAPDVNYQASKTTPTAGSSFPYACQQLASAATPGRMYNSTSAFEQETIANHYKKPEQSCRVFWDGQLRETVLVWISFRLGDRTEYEVGKPDKRGAGHISNTYKAVVHGLGVHIMEKLDAVGLMKTYTKKMMQGGSALTPVDADA